MIVGRRRRLKITIATLQKEGRGMKAMMGRLSEVSARKFVLGSEFRLGDNRQPWLYSFTVEVLSC